MKNIGIVDRLFRLIGLHLMISLADTAIFEAGWISVSISLTGLYLILTMLSGFDPVYKLLSIQTLESNSQEPEAKLK